MKDSIFTLTTYHIHFQALKELDDNIVKFNKNYMLLNDYLEDASERLHQISSSTIEVHVP